MEKGPTEGIAPCPVKGAGGLDLPRETATVAGSPRRLPAGAPTDPYMNTLAHTAPQVMDSPAGKPGR